MHPLGFYKINEENIWNYRQYLAPSRGAGTGKTASAGGTLERTVAHELGHSANLSHLLPGTLNGNLMHQTWRPNAGMKITGEQILEIKKTYDNGLLNRGQQTYQ